jgi:general secretion pathway protein K
MKITTANSASGIALIMVLIVIVVLAGLAFVFAASMNVETKLARNATHDTEMEWMGRSGIELARYVLAQATTGPFGQVDALNQKWAGGPGDTNDPASAIPLDNYQLGNATLSIKIVDQDRKFNINTADSVLLRQALNRMEMDAALSPSIADAIIDWRDPDDRESMNGAESDYYQSLNPPYVAKNGPFDDLTELLWVRGVTPAMYYGGSGGAGRLVRRVPGQSRAMEEPAYPMGLQDLFTTHSSGLLNVNTASAQVLSCIPGIDPNVAQAIITARAGLDGADGTEDDTPFRSAGDLARIGLGGAEVSQFTRFFTTRSLVFEVKVDVRIDKYHRQYVAMVRRNGRDTQVLKMYWN